MVEDRVDVIAVEDSGDREPCCKAYEEYRPEGMFETQDSMQDESPALIQLLVT